MKHNTVPNLIKACEVLRQLGAAENGLSQSDVEERVNLPRATAFRMLTTLVQEGFSEKRGSRYFIGTALAQLGTQALSSNSISELSRPILADLAQRTGETTHLAIPSGPHSLILEVCDSPNPVHVSSRANTLAEMHCSSTGKIFLAFLANGDDIVDQLTLQKCTDRTHTSAAALRGDLEVVRELGLRRR